MSPRPNDDGIADDDNNEMIKIMIQTKPKQHHFATRSERSANIKHMIVVG